MRVLSNMILRAALERWAVRPTSWSSGSLVTRLWINNSTGFTDPCLLRCQAHYQLCSPRMKFPLDTSTYTFTSASQCHGWQCDHLGPLLTTQSSLEMQGPRDEPLPFAWSRPSHWFLPSNFGQNCRADHCCPTLHTRLPTSIRKRRETSHCTIKSCIDELYK